MISRERVLEALNHQEADRIPFDLGGTCTTIEVDAYEELKKHLGVKSKTRIFCRRHAEIDEEVLMKFNVDTRYVRINPPSDMKKEVNCRSYVDEWGIRWGMPLSSYYYDMLDHPLEGAGIEDLEGYPWPDPHDPERTRGLREKAKYLFERTDRALVADAVGLGIFEQSWALRGFENFLVDLLVNPQFARLLLDKVADIYIGLLEEFLAVIGEYIQVVTVTEDIAGENGLLISLRTYREIIKPYHVRLCKSIKEKTSAYLLWHVCGSIREAIPDLIDLGIDALNPIQVSATNMDTRNLKRDFGEKMTFWGGGCDNRQVLPLGTPREIREEVRRRIKDLASGGGFVFAPIHNIQPGVPPENIVAMWEALQEHGNYS